MKWPFWVVGALVLLAAAGFFGWKNFKISGDDPSFASSYRRSFVDSCADNAAQSLASAGRTVDDALKTKVDLICGCGADTSIADFQKAGGQTMAEMMTMMSDPAFKTKMGEIMQACQQRFGPV